MSRSRIENRTLPPCLPPRHGRSSYVEKNLWHPITQDLPSTLLEYARLIAGADGSGLMPDRIDRAPGHVSPGLKPSAAKQYPTVARALEESLGEFAPHQVTTKDLLQALSRHFDGGPSLHNRALIGDVLAIRLSEISADGVRDAHLHDQCTKSLTDAKRQGKNAQALGGHSSPP